MKLFASDAEYQAFVKIVSKTVIETLRSEHRYKESMNVYQKTEKILRNYPKLKTVIKDKQKQIKQLRLYGIPKKSKDIVNYGAATNASPDLKLMEEQVEERVTDIRYSIRKTQKYIDVIDNALNIIYDDPYYEVVTLYYFKDKPIDIIAEHIEKDASTVARNKKRLVNNLSLILFPDESMKEIF